MTLDEKRDARRMRWLAKRSRFASLLIDFDRTSTYSRHRVNWHVPGYGWVSVEGQSAEEAIDKARAWRRPKDTA